MGGIGGGTKILANLRTKSSSTRVNGRYFGNVGSRRRVLWPKIIRGVRPAIITWFLWEVKAKDERKWWCDDGTCQQFRRRKVIACPFTIIPTSTLPVPSIVTLEPKGVW